MSHLQRLDAESVHILREVVAEADRPVMLYSIGKDSAVMVHLARKAFHPAPLPFPLLHVDTTWKFRDMYALRARMAAEPGVRLLVHHNPEALARGINPFDHGSALHTDLWKTQGLKQALAAHGFDAAFDAEWRALATALCIDRVQSIALPALDGDPVVLRREGRPWHLGSALIEHVETCPVDTERRLRGPLRRRCNRSTGPTPISGAIAPCLPGDA